MTGVDRELEKEAFDFATLALANAGYAKDLHGVIQDGLVYGYVTAMRIGKARGQANAAVAFQESLPVAMKRFQEVAWDEGAETALNHAIRNDDGVTLRLEQSNPYKEESHD